MNNEIFYYYLRNEGKHPYGCVAITDNGDGTIKRGVSICSKKDNFNKPYSRALALKRLKQTEKVAKGYFGVYFGEKCNCPIEEAEKFQFNKWERNAKPTEFEQRIIKKPSDAMPCREI